MLITNGIVAITFANTRNCSSNYSVVFHLTSAYGSTTLLTGPYGSTTLDYDRIQKKDELSLLQGRINSVQCNSIVCLP